jgi:hypothetical protein
MQISEDFYALPAAHRCASTPRASSAANEDSSTGRNQRTNDPQLDNFQAVLAGKMAIVVQPPAATPVSK